YLIPRPGSRRGCCAHLVYDLRAASVPLLRRCKTSLRGHPESLCRVYSDSLSPTPHQRSDPPSDEERNWPVLALELQLLRAYLRRARLADHRRELKYYHPAPNNRASEKLAQLGLPSPCQSR